MRNNEQLKNWMKVEGVDPNDLNRALETKPAGRFSRRQVLVGLGSGIAGAAVAACTPEQQIRVAKLAPTVQAAGAEKAGEALKAVEAVYASGTPVVTEVIKEKFQLAGTGYFSNKNPERNTDPNKDPYFAVWSEDGWLHQPNLPEEGKRVWHANAVTFPTGKYQFNGVSCNLFLDVERNGNGSANPKVASKGNGLPFTVVTADDGQAWGLIECDQTDVTGWSIQYKNPLSK